MTLDLPIHPYLRHPHTGAPIRALGYRRNGDLIWPVLGASEDDPGDDSGGDQDGGDGGDQGDGDGVDQLGDAGKKALDAMKGQRNKARADLKPWTALARELGVSNPDDVRALLDKAKTPGGDAPDAEKVRREAIAEATRAANDRIVRSEVKAAAAGKLADPADALRLLDLTQFEVDADGEVDEAAIKEAIDDLLKTKPYLAAQGGRRFQGSGDGGHRGDGKPNLTPGIGRLQHAYAQSTKKRS